MEKHKIDWLNKPGYKGETWNPIVGCTKVSPACRSCYAEKMAVRLSGIKTTEYYKNVVSGGKWNGQTHFVETNIIQPMGWKKPRMIFVCSMSDLFHETIPFEQIDEVIRTIIACPNHIFILLTKRPERMKDYFCWKYNKNHFFLKSPIQNIWLGVTSENQEQADKRIPILLDIPAAKRFVSIEPMLGEIDLSRFLPEGMWGNHPTKGKMLYPYYFMSKCKCGWIGSSELWNGGEAIGDTGDLNDGTCPKCGNVEPDEVNNKIDQIIVGGESGHNARPMHTEWVKYIRNQCKEANTPFFFKQWGEWIQVGECGNSEDDCEYYHHPKCTRINMEGGMGYHGKNPIYMMKKGRSNTGSELDGVYHKEFPDG